MPKKNPKKTPRSTVKVALQRLFLRSRERAYALKRDGYTCQTCHRKQSKAKGKEFSVQVHHIDGIDWEEIIDIIFERVLVSPERMITLCKEHHEEIHEREKKNELT